mmetsp:Transcript_22774/g.38483  ORF Transcript_22774/g.38483 Transcript_22774/m.38483 type:complete len:188 (+) Transcript_22774:149-712(+)
MASFDNREVRLNIYDLHSCNVWASGIGAYHSGVEVSGSEYSFSETGIFKCSPRSAPEPAQFNRSIVLGVHRGSANDVSRILREMRDEFPPGCYNLLTKNCNVFSDAFSQRIVGAEIPRWVNRLAHLGGWFASFGAPDLSPRLEQEENSEVTSDGVSGACKAPAKKKELTELQRAALAKLKSNSKSKK